MKQKLGRLVTSFALVLGSVAAQAGPVIIDGTDANDHGSFNGSANVAGWLYMQRALENLASNLSAGASVAKTVTVVGANVGTQAGNAIDSAFALAVLPGSGWSLVHVDGAAAIGTFFSTLSAATSSILYIASAGNSSGDLDTSELAAVNANAAAINNFVGGAGNALNGGGLFSMAETGTGAYGWLTTLIPGIVFTDVGSGGIGNNITLTAAGVAAFPALTNADLAGADPWHGYFSGNLGGLSVLGVANDNSGFSRNLILGGGAGTVFNCGQTGQPACDVPEPETLPLVAIAGLALVLTGLRRRKTQ